MRSCHPRATNEAFLSVGKDCYNFWYKVHYQQIFIEKEGDKAEKAPLSPQVSLCPAARAEVANMLAERERYLQLFNLTQEVVIFRLAPTSRLLVGMGGAHARENGLTIHPVYGIPYIPGSSLKGITRHWAIEAFLAGNEQRLEERPDSLKPDEERAVRAILDIFGTTECEGMVEFFDAFPEVEVKLTPDVLTVHYKEYYQNGRRPSDDQSPVPIDFYSVQAHYFKFMLSAPRDKKGRLTDLPGGKLLLLAQNWLSQVLAELGVGAKTSIGYGRFRLLEGTEQKQQSSIEAEKVKKVPSESEKGSADFSHPLALEILRLGTSQTERERSKGEIFKKIMALPREEAMEPAVALKRYWEKTGDWKAKGDKQVKKVKQLEELLKEDLRGKG